METIISNAQYTVMDNTTSSPKTNCMQSESDKDHWLLAIAQACFCGRCKLCVEEKIYSSTWTYKQYMCTMCKGCDRFLSEHVLYIIDSWVNIYYTILIASTCTCMYQRLMQIVCWKEDLFHSITWLYRHICVQCVYDQ